MTESRAEVGGAGWYPDPTMSATQRYWDGQAWTEHVTPLGPGDQSQVSTSAVSEAVASGVAKGAFLVISVCVLVVLILGAVVSANNQDREACESLRSIAPEATC